MHISYLDPVTGKDGYLCYLVQNPPPGEEFTWKDLVNNRPYYVSYDCGAVGGKLHADILCYLSAATISHFSRKYKKPEWVIRRIKNDDDYLRLWNYIHKSIELATYPREHRNWEVPSDEELAPYIQTWKRKQEEASEDAPKEKKKSLYKVFSMQKHFEELMDWMRQRTTYISKETVESLFNEYAREHKYLVYGNVLNILRNIEIHF